MAIDHLDFIPDWAEPTKHSFAYKAPPASLLVRTSPPPIAYKHHFFTYKHPIAYKHLLTTYQHPLAYKRLLQRQAPLSVRRHPLYSRHFAFIQTWVEPEPFTPKLHSKLSRRNYPHSSYCLSWAMQKQERPTEPLIF